MYLFAHSLRFNFSKPFCIKEFLILSYNTGLIRETDDRTNYSFENIDTKSTSHSKKFNTNICYLRWRSVLTRLKVCKHFSKYVSFIRLRISKFYTKWYDKSFCSILKDSSGNTQMKIYGKLYKKVDKHLTLAN